MSPAGSPGAAAVAHPPMSLRRLLGDVVREEIAADACVTGLAMDSRGIRPGDLFLACRGRGGHGLAFLAQALDNGAAAVAWEPDAAGAPAPALPAGAATVPLVRVEGLAALAGPLAARFYGAPTQRLEVMGVTGTNGKSTVAWLLASASERLGTKTYLMGTLGAGRPGDLDDAVLTTPDAVTVQRHLAQALARDPALRAAAMEVSSHALDQGRVNGVRFAAAVFTNLSRDHLDYHGDMAAYAKAKARLFCEHAPRLAVINVDDAHGQHMAQLAARAKARVVTVGTEPATDAAARHLHVRAVQAREGGGLRVSLGAAPAAHRVELDLPALLGRFNAMNAAQAFAVLVESGGAPEDVAAALAACPPPPGRMQCLGGGARRPLVVVDYAHTPDSLEQVLTTLRAHTRQRLICVFGCGGERDTGKRALMGRVAGLLADEVVVTDDNPRGEDPRGIVRDILQGLARQGTPVTVEHDRREAIRRAIGSAVPGDVVLVAGKGHEQFQLRGSERLPFSDADEARAALEGGGA